MGSRPTIDFLSAMHDLHNELFIPWKDSSFHDQVTQISNYDRHSCFCTENEDDVDEYAEDLFDPLLPHTPEESADDIHSLTRFNAQPDVRLRLGESSLSSSLQLCTQFDHELQLSTHETTSGSTARVKNIKQMPDSSSTSWASNSVAPPRPEPETGAYSDHVEEKTILTDVCATRGTSPRTDQDSPILEWIMARLKDWQKRLKRLPTTGTTSQRLHNIATALTDVGDEIKLIRDNLLGDKTEFEAGDENGFSVADEDSRLVPHSLIVHGCSNTFLLSFQQLCFYMEELPAWILGSVLGGSVVFWHYDQSEEGLYMDKPDACATLPDTDLTRLTCTDAYKFVNSINRVEDDAIFRVQTVFVRE